MKIVKNVDLLVRLHAEVQEEEFEDTPNEELQEIIGTALRAEFPDKDLTISVQVVGNETSKDGKKDGKTN